MEIYEEILWEGKPKKGFQLVLEDLLIIPFLCFFAFLGYYISHGSFLKLALFGFGLLYIIYIRYVKDLLDRQHTEYYITPTRVVISIKDKVTSLYYTSMKEVSCTEHPFTFTYGSIIFGKEENIFGDYNEKFTFGQKGGINLERNKITIAFIKDYKAVYTIIKEEINKTYL